MPLLTPLMPIGITGGTTGGIIIGITTIEAQPKLEASNETRAQQHLRGRPIGGLSIIALGEGAAFEEPVCTALPWLFPPEMIAAVR